MHKRVCKTLYELYTYVEMSLFYEKHMNSNIKHYKMKDYAFHDCTLNYCNSSSALCVILNTWSCNISLADNHNDKPLQRGSLQPSDLVFRS
jgi:hypothetical protein